LRALSHLLVVALAGAMFVSGVSAEEEIKTFGDIVDENTMVYKNDSTL